MRHALLIAVVLVGCRQQTTPLANPFLAPDRVPPPGTRTPPPGTALPYYDAVPPASGMPPTGIPPSGATQPAAGSWQTGQLGPDSAGADATTPAARVAATPSPEERVAVPADDERERFAQVATSDAASVARNGPSGDRPFPDIGDLPPVPPSATEPVRQAAHAEGAGSRTLRDAFRAAGEALPAERFAVQTASFESAEPARDPVGAPSRDEPGDPPGRQRYAYDPQYAWLQGKLEFSRASQQWKLRYIPIDGETDDFGGSVILADPDQLGDLAAGDFVRVRGALVEGQHDESSFAPLYRIHQIEPLAD